MNDLTVLKEVRSLIETGWTQDVLARSEEGIQCDPEDEDAVSWCLTGAIRRAIWQFPSLPGRPLYSLRIELVLRAAAGGSKIKSLVLFNDAPGQTKDTVLDLIDRAIEIEGRR